MKRIIWALLIMIASSYVAMAQEQTTTETTSTKNKDKKEEKELRKAYNAPKFRVGLTVSPLLSWMKQDSKLISRGKVRGGVEYGVVVEYFPVANYGISTGLTVLYSGGNLVYKDPAINAAILESVHLPSATAGTPINAKFKTQYLTLPIYLKLKTNQIGYFTYFGELGVQVGFCVEGKTDAHQGDVDIYANENFLKRKNLTQFTSTIVNFGIHGGGGIEYAVSDRVSLVAGLAYNHGFINVVKDGDDKKVSLSSMELKIGVLF